MLSIIIPCLNEADGIVDALAALEPLRRRGAEVIVVDGGSDDDSLARAKRHADTAFAAARGRAAQMNAGAARARGDILLFLHADCRLPEAADRSIAEDLQRTGRRWGRFDVRLDGRHRLLPVVAAAMNARSRLTGIATGDQGIFVTRSLFEAAGGYAGIALMEDVELCRRLKRYGPPLCLAHRIAVSARRWENDGVLHTIVLMWRLRFAYWRGAHPDKLALRYAATRH